MRDGGGENAQAGDQTDRPTQKRDINKQRRIVVVVACLGDRNSYSTGVTGRAAAVKVGGLNERVE